MTEKGATGTREWAPAGNINISVGCPNNCRYCYAKNNAVVRFKRVRSGEWKNEKLQEDLHDE